MGSYLNKRITMKSDRSVLWHAYHTILVIELGLLLIIEFVEFLWMI